MVDRVIEEKVKISPKAQKILNLLLQETPKLKKMLSLSEEESINELKNWAEEELKQNTTAYKYYKEELKGRKPFKKLKWKDIAAIRILDYIQYANLEYEDLNLRGKQDISNPFRILWLAANHRTGGGKYLFFLDMLELFRQFTGKNKLNKPDESKMQEWMNRHPSGLDPEIIEARKENKHCILRVILEMIESGEVKSTTFSFDPGMSHEQKMEKMNEWWESKLFHLKFAVRKPDLLNKMLDYSLDPETMQTLHAAKEAGIPFFVNPYYLSLLDTKDRTNADLAIRDYIIYSQELIDEFGHIVAWEKEDIVEPGKPNAAGWLLPSDHNIHRRYPEVAILIPDSMGRACGGLCVSCQRMYDFQRGNLNFDLERLKPTETWPKKLVRLLKYFEEDTQLRDILITGGDALMSSDKSLKKILDAVYEMALNKKKNNKYLKEGEKHAEMLRVRLGTRLPVYLPQRINDELAEILADFKQKASKIGIKQFVIQTHFESAMEVTPETVNGLKRIISAGWTITNQMVFTTAASRRGHTAKLRKILNDAGVLTYYTFSVKGYMENFHNFATNARAVQEQLEEKRLGVIPKQYNELVHTFPENAEDMIENINALREKANIPFLATDRNVLNLPGVGKSLTYRTIGITKQGRRILEFDHDANRRHSPIIDQIGKVIIVESKPIGEYLNQIEDMGEDINEYKNLWGYSIGETEERMPIYIYPDYDFKTTEEFTNLELQDQ